MTRAQLYLSTALIAFTLPSGTFAQDAPPDSTPVFLGTVTLSAGQRDDRNLLDSPVSASVIDRDEIELRQAPDFATLLNDTPGVLIFGGPRGISNTPSIRGFDDDQVVLRVDGGRVNFGQTHRGRFFLDPDMVQRVEVVRGGGSTLYGSGALGGVIAIETRDAADLLKPGQTIGGRVSLGYESQGDTLTGNLSVFGDHGAVDYLAYFANRDMRENYENADFEIGASKVDTQNALLKLGFEPTAAQRIELNLTRYTDDGVVPPNASAASDPADDVDRDAQQEALRLSWDYAPEGSNLIDLSVLYYVNQLEIEEDRTADGRLDDTTYYTNGLEITNRASLDWGNPVTLVYGFEVFDDRQKGTRDGATRASFPDATARTIGLFAEATVEVRPELDFIFGLRGDSYTRDPDDDTLDTIDETFLSPRIGFSFRPNNNWQVFGNASRAFRAPSLSEVYSDGVHFAFQRPTQFNAFGAPTQIGNFTNTFEPNPDLDPEVADQVEVGLRFSGGDVMRDGDRLDVGVTLYNASVRDYIDSIVEDFDTVPDAVAVNPFGPDLATFTANTITENTDARLWGAEVEVDYDTEFFYAKAGLSLNRGKRSNGGNLGSLPQERLTTTLGLRPLPDVDMGLRATFAAERTEVPTGVAEADAWQTVDLYASWNPSSGPLEGARVLFGIDNAMDEVYTIYPNTLPQPGRSYKLTATYQF